MTDYIDPADGTVWVVSSGSYSDYRVHCAAPSERAAKEIAAAMNADHARGDYMVESLPVIDRAERVTIYGNEAVITDDATVTDEGARNRKEWNVNPLYPERLCPVTVRWVRAPIYHQAGRLEVYGTDRDRVRKTFSDMKAQLLADPALRSRREFTR